MPRHGQEPDDLEDMQTRTLQEQPDTGPAPARPAVAGAMRPGRGSRIQLPGVNYPPEGAHPVDKPGIVLLVGLAGPSVAVTVEVPIDTSLRVDGIGWGADTEIALNLLTWSLLANGSVTEAYFDIPAAVGSFRHTSHVFVHVRGPATVQLLGQNSDVVASSYTYFGRLKGWLYQEFSSPAAFAAPRGTS
jgi:hypothetical protein